MNLHLKRRFDAADQEDAHPNAIIAFLTFSARTLRSLDERLADFAPCSVDSPAGNTAAPPAVAGPATARLHRSVRVADAA